MKKECAYVRKSLKRYLDGHVFRLQKIRIDRHLKSCVVCRSEYEALKQVEETRLILNDIKPDEGILSWLRGWLPATTGLKKILYRPLWIAGIIAAAAIIYHYAVTPRQFDIELENIAKTTPSGTQQAAASSATVTVTPAASVPSAAVKPTPAAAPLPVTLSISQEEEQATIGRINDVLRGQGQLANKKFSGEAREISGSLTADGLLALFTRLEQAGKVSYNRKRLESFPSAQPIPFVLILKSVPRSVESPAPRTSPVQRPVNPAQPSSAAPSTAPTPSTER